MTPATGAPAPDFMLSVTPNAVTVAPGGSGAMSSTLTINAAVAGTAMRVAGACGDVLFDGDRKVS